MSLSTSRLIQILRSQSPAWIFRKILVKFLFATGLYRFFSISYEGFKIKLLPTALSETLWLDPYDRKAEEDFFRAYLKPGDQVLDIGANIGCLALTASVAVGPRGHVYSVEAHPRTFAYLNENLRFNRVTNVETHHFAVGDKEGVITFSNRSDDSANSVVASGGLEVPLKPLDSAFAFTKEIALFKIDVEGYELFVLKGARRLLRQSQCVYFEVWEQHLARFHYSLSEILSFLENEGFVLLKLKNGLVSALPSDYSAPQCENLIATRSVDQFLQRTQYRWAGESSDWKRASHA